MRKWKIVVLVILVALGIGAGALYYAGKQLAAKFEPYIRDQALAYLRERFRADVDMGALRVNLPRFSPVKLWMNKGKGSSAGVEADDIILRQDGKKLFAIKHFSFTADLGRLFDPTKQVPLIILDGMEIYVPPKGQRPNMKKGDGPAPKVIIDELLITNARLVIENKDPSKKPLDFELQRIRLLSAGVGVAMKYEASLRNPKPPGQVEATGTFGPWDTDEPGATPLNGDFVFSNANLGVFAGVDGILDSKGSFQGELSHIFAKGTATVPDFRLKMAGNPVPLVAEYDVEVDGTNGNTILKPVHATLGQTKFTTSGAVLKKNGEARRTIDLDVIMPKGHLADLLHLAMKGTTPFMSGEIYLKTKIQIPPLEGKVKEKLLLDGTFKIQNGQFLSSQIQDKIDGLSRQAQGQPKNQAIDEVFTDLNGKFKMEEQAITFENLSFAIPGALMDIAGAYDISSEQLDFHGTAKLKARVSQTQTGWKRWALKPVDPFFAKNGAGTFVKIKITGDRKEPKFGLDRK